MKKLALVASAAVALLCAASLVATPADAKKKAAKKPAADTHMAGGPGMGPRHDLGGPMKSGKMCWKDGDSRGMGYWAGCPKK